MARLTASKRASLPKKDFGLPGQGSGPKGSGSGSYPMPDKEHASLAKGFAKRFASPAQRAKIDAKANKMLGKGGGGMTAKQDAKYDKAHGIKAGSAADKRMDKKLMGGGGSKSPTGGAKPPAKGGSKGSSGRAIQGPRGGGGIKRGRY